MEFVGLGLWRNLRAGRGGRASLIGVATAASIGLWCGLDLAFPDGGATTTWLPGITRSLGSELFVVAGLLRLGYWRSTRAAADLRAAVGLIAIGAVIPVLVMFTTWAADGTHQRPVDHLARLIVFAPILLILGPWPLRRADRWAPSAGVLAVLGAAAVALGLIVALPHVLASPAAVRTLSVTIEAGLAYGWVALAAHAMRSGARSASWTSAAMLVLAAGAGLRALSVASSVAVLANQPVFTLVAGALFTCAAAIELAEAMRRDGERRRAMSRSLLETRQILARAEQDERERLHDARSAVFGVIGASQLLATDEVSPGVDRDSLQQLIEAELTRLHAVLDAAIVEAVTDFDVAEALAPVVLAHRIEQPRIRAQIESLRATGRPQSIATVLDNLLRNARTHAPGSSVAIRAELVGDTVAVIVEDNGPGIPPGERSAVVLPGVRGSTALGCGSGLGLANCVRMLADQQGELRVEECAGGGTRVVVTLPAAVQQLAEAPGTAEQAMVS